MSRKSTRIIVFFVAIVVVSSLLALGVYSKIQQKKQSLAYNAASVRASALPEVISNVKDLQIAGVKLVDEGTETAHLDIDVVNNSDEPCYTVEFVARGKADVSAQGADGYANDPDNPKVVIPPHGIRTIKVFLGGMLEGPPIVLAAARFANGKEDGDPEILELEHRDERRSRAEKAARAKGGQK
jgi:hypothetical protein